MGENETSRLWIIGLIFSFFLSGIPVWYKTTQVYRASLPESRLTSLNIENVSSNHLTSNSQALPILFKIQFNINMHKSIPVSSETIGSLFVPDPNFIFIFSNSSLPVNGQYSIDLECASDLSPKSIGIDFSASRQIKLTLYGACDAGKALLKT